MRHTRFQSFLSGVVLASALILATASDGRGERSPIQQTPDGSQILVTKRIGTTVWSIARHLNEDQTPLSAVVYSAGEDPSFLYCPQIADTGSVYQYRCWQSSKCTENSCESWGESPLNPIPLPHEFFELPTGSTSSAANSGPSRESAVSLAGRASTNREAGVQVPPPWIDERNAPFFVNKPIGNDQWAFTRMPGTGLLAGMVVNPMSLDDTQFLYCTQTYYDAAEFIHSCQFARGCTATSCGPNSWDAPVSGQPLPSSFFNVPVAQNSTDFEVTLEGGSGPAAVYSYSREAVCRNGCAGNWESADGSTFDYLETYQVVVEDGAPTGIRVKDMRANNPTNCMAGYWRSEYHFFDQAAESFPLPPNEKVMQVTFIPFSAATCSQPTEDFDAGRALSVLISYPEYWKDSPPPGTKGRVCQLTRNLGYEDLPYVADGCTIDRPHWSAIPDANNPGQLAGVAYNGTLATMAKSGAAADDTIFIQLGLDVDLSIPLTSSYFYLPTVGGDLSSCENAAMQYNNNISNPQPGDLSNFIADCAIPSDPSATAGFDNDFIWLENTQAKIVVSGFGRINGYQLLTEYTNGSGEPYSGPCGEGTDRGDIGRCTSPEQIVEYGEWRVWSSLLGASSTNQTSIDGEAYAIDVSGITVGFPPHRNRSSVNLNVAGLTFFEEGLDSNNFPVKMYDFKLVGGWSDAGDGPEVQGQNSRLTNMYLHIADDSIKVATNDIVIADTTCLQGSAGGAVNIGSYGYNRTIDGAQVNGLYIPRITQRPTNQDFNSGADLFSASRGVITAPTCPVLPLVDNPGTTGSLSNVVIDGVTVWAIGGDEGPNSIAAPVAIGVSNQSIYCTGPSAQNFNVGPITVKNFTSYVNPQNDSFLFTEVSGLSTNVVWGQPNAVAFCEPDTNARNRCAVDGMGFPSSPVMMQSQDRMDGNFFYYVCGDGVPPANCWTNQGTYSTLGQMGQSNLAYWPSNSTYYDGAIVFPYDR